MKKITLLSFLLFSSLVFSQFSEDFEGGVPGSFVATVNSGSATWGNCSGTLGGQTCPMSGSVSASYYTSSYNGNSATLTTPTLDLSSLPSYQLKFSYSQKAWGSDQNTLSVEVSSDDGSSWTVLTLLDTNVSVPTEVELFLDGYTSSTTKIRFVAVSNWGYATILDDVVVQPTPSCLYPADFVVSDITTVGATVAWSGGSTSSGNVVDFDASATFLGYMNWFELPANGGGYVNGSSWTVAALKSVLNTGANTLTLQPNFNTYAENPTDAYWVNQTTGAGNKNMQAATYVEDATANGADLTFQGSVSSYTLDAAYTAKYFIKALDPANGWADVFGGSKTFDLPQSGNFSVSATAAELPAGLVVQYGFEVFGANANPADEVALGSVVVTASLDIWEYELVLAGETPTGVGTSTTNNPLTITGCYSNTGYDLYVRRVCDSSYSDWTMTSFTTDCDAVTAFPYSHGFETLDCWNNASSSTPWALDDGTDYGPGTVTEGVSAVFFNDYDFASGSTSDLMSPWIDASTLTSPRLTFDYYDAGGSDTVKVLVYDGTTTTVVYTTAGTVTPWTQIVVDLPEYGGETFKIGFRGTSVYGASNPHIDNLVLDEGPSCLPPSDFVVSDITAVGATLAWSGGSTSSGNVVDFDASATFLGYMNWFELPANGGGYVNGSSWTVAALKSVLNTGANTLTLQPNFNTYAENPTDAYWVNQTTGAGNKNMQAATYVEDATANGADLTFQGSVSSYTLDAAYTAKYFIKALDPANGWADVFGGSKTFDLPQSGNFSVSATAAELPAGLVVQYGFEVFGANANPADEVALGSVVVTASLDIWEYELVLAGETPTGVGTSTTNNPLTITGCYDNTAYDVYVRLDCGGGDYSTWSGPVSFTTLCSTVTAYPDVTTFENNPPTACWYEANSGAIVDGPSNLGSAAWRSGTTYSDGTASVASNGINLYFNDVRDWLISPMYDLSVGDLSLIVNVAVTNYNSQAADNMGSDDEVNLLMSTDAGSSWTVLETWSASNQPATNGTEFVYDLSGMSGAVQFAFMASDGTTDDSEDYDFHVGYMELTSALSVQEIELSQSL
ncbi:MAG: hypothetical protein NWS37_05685, partial [Flavobacteriaceae bacterium]|nr:hypothetical protein [Flavobacteriaceae bacterium]